MARKKRFTAECNRLTFLQHSGNLLTYYNLQATHGIIPTTSLKAHHNKFHVMLTNTNVFTPQFLNNPRKRHFMAISESPYDRISDGFDLLVILICQECTDLIF